MKKFRLPLLIPLFLAGCSCGEDYPPGKPVGHELKSVVEQERMRDLKKNPVIRLGISGENPAGVPELEKKCGEHGWRLQIVVCPEKRLRGLLRSGAVDLIPAKELSEPDAESIGFSYVPPGFLAGNSLIREKLLR